MCIDAYQERIKLSLDCLGAAGLETPGFAKELSIRNVIMMDEVRAGLVINWD